MLDPGIIFLTLFNIAKQDVFFFFFFDILMNFSGWKSISLLNKFAAFSLLVSSNIV